MSPMRARKLLAFSVLLSSVCMAGCRRLGDFTFLSTKNLDLTRFSTEAAEKLPPVTGVDSKPIIIFVNTGIPSIEEAADRAMAKANAKALTNAVIYNESWYIPYIYGENKFEVRGNPMK